MTIPTDRMVVPWRSALLASLPGVAHAVTHRVEGMGAADGNVAYSAPRDTRDAWSMRQRWCAASGVDAAQLVTLGQIHGAVVQRVASVHAGWGAMPGSGQIGLGDALVTHEVGPVLMTLHADCQPILFVDPRRGRRRPVIGVAHAGWRGTVADVAGQTVRAMADAYGTRAADVHVVLGPAIGPCCYEVGEEVAQAWRDRAGDAAGAALRPSAERYMFSLRSANALLLNRAGIRAEQIETSTLCTRCEGRNWFSHRGQGPATGRFGAMITIEG